MEASFYLITDKGIKGYKKKNQCILKIEKYRTATKRCKYIIPVTN